MVEHGPRAGNEIQSRLWGFECDVLRHDDRSAPIIKVTLVQRFCMCRQSDLRIASCGADSGASFVELVIMIELHGVYVSVQLQQSVGIAPTYRGTLITVWQPLKTAYSIALCNSN